MASASAVSLSSGLPTISVLEGYAVEELHGNEGLLAVLADFVDGADVGMIEGGGGARLAAKTLQSLGIAGEIVGQEFERDEAAECGVLGLIDDTHAAAAQLFENPVMRYGFADHGGKPAPYECFILRRSGRQGKGWDLLALPREIGHRSG